MDKLKIIAVILNYKGLEDTLECLDSLRRCSQDNLKTEFIVVDNNSDDGSVEALLKLEDVNLIENQKNLGFAGGINVGIEAALKKETDFILILNNDTIVDRFLIKNLLNSSQYGGIISPKIYFAPGFEFHKLRYTKSESGKVIWYAGGRIDWQNIIGKHIGVDDVDHGQFSKRLEIDLATGACMLIKRQVFEKIGFFDKKYFLYLEDMDFCVRAKRAGFKIIFEPKAFKTCSIQTKLKSNKYTCQKKSTD
ncbi:MAG: putative glycosyltransferase [Candidatus Curtissbacteria bacterium GW2011_GWA2_41_24]|uniref:Putative glycosyltransferase n=1 Tax=Candidatus Curtissbacteria bacterium GW2011_GWA2_41_24 TaxID=1618411 RepID=A0A0G0Y3X6_9BACT|nr:MAG: putative glycosyltransferase [Candidatus Curtissbacteria bacterium GW2011_GWA2_41_24]